MYLCGPREWPFRHLVQLCALCALCALLLVDPCTVVYPGSSDLATLNILAIPSEQIILDQNDLKLKKIVLVTGQKKVKKDRTERAGV